MEEFILNIKGIMCEGCENRIQNALKNMDGIETVKADHTKGTVTILGNNIDIDKIKEKIEDIGFEV